MVASIVVVLENAPNNGCTSDLSLNGIPVFCWHPMPTLHVRTAFGLPNACVPGGQVLSTEVHTNIVHWDMFSVYMEELSFIFLNIFIVVSASCCSSTAVTDPTHPIGLCVV